jgi:putative phosphoribosyl transferase
MYFKNRAEAGKLLADQLEKYRYEDTTVVALSPHGVEVGAAIAREIRCDLSLMVTAPITAKGEPGFILGTLDPEGDYVVNQLVPVGEMEEYMLDMWEYVEEEKLHKFYDMVELVGGEGITNRQDLVGRNVILATEGVVTGLSIMAAMHYLKPISYNKAIAAVPVGPAEALHPAQFPRCAPLL